MTELYSVRDVARIFALQEARLRYWLQTGFVGPSVRKGGRFFYTFRDLIAVKAAKDLLAAGLSMQKVRRNLDSLRAALPDEPSPAARLRICSDGETVVAVDDDVVFEPSTGQVVMAFNLPGLADQIAEVVALRPDLGGFDRAEVDADLAERDGLDDDDGGVVGDHVDDDPTDASAGPTAYRCFLDGCGAEDRGELEAAEQLYRQALTLQPTLAAALTNLGNLRHRRGDVAAARALYEQALEHEPDQPEARYNLGNLLEDLGETDRAIAELRRVCLQAPEFADAHYNLGLMLARVGGAAQARKHLARYLELDGRSEWAGRARGFLDQLAA